MSSTSPSHARWRARLDDLRIPSEYHVADFAAADLDEVVALFRRTFRRDVPPERVRRGLAHRYLDNPYTGHPATAPLVARHGGGQGPMIGFFGCLPTPVRFRGAQKVSGFPMDFFVRDDFQPRRIGLILLRALLARTEDVIFTSSAGPATQALLRYYHVIPIPQFQRQWALPVERIARAAPAGGRLGALGRRLRARLAARAGAALAPLPSVTDEMVAQAAAHTAEASYRVERTRPYLEWRFGPLVRAGAPECEVLGLAAGGRSLGWIVTRRREATLEVLDWFVPRERYAETLGLVGARARALGCDAVAGRGMQRALREAVLALGAAESTEMMLYWTWAPDPAVYEGMDWDLAYLSSTDGDLTLPWNLDPDGPAAA